MSSLARSRFHTIVDERGVRSRLLKLHRARWAALRWALLVVASMLMATLQSGCAATNDARLVEYDYEAPSARNTGMPGRSKAEQSRAAPTPSSVKFDIPDEPAKPEDQVAPETQRLADQSQRDVDVILNARRNAAVPAGDTGLSSGASPTEGAGTASPTLGSSVAAPRRIVQWNDPPAKPPAPLPVADSRSGGAPSPSAAPPATQPTTEMNVSGGVSGAVSGSAGPAPPVDVEALRPDRIKQLIIDLSRELYAEGAYSAQPMRELAVIAAMSMREEDRKLDPAAIPDLTDEERQLLASLQVFFASVGQTLESGEDVHTGVALAANTLRQSLVHEPQLKLPTVALCTRVGGFGDYSPFEKNVFLAASDQKAIVYLEIEDFVSDINLNDEFVTELSQQLTIYSDRDGIPVWKEDWLSATDVTRNKRQDFFTTQIITLPKALGVGKYTLKIRVRDEKSKAESETSIGFELVADPKMVQ